MARGELDAHDIVGMLIESIEEKNEQFGMQKERNEKNHRAEIKRILDEKDSSIVSAIDSRNRYSQQLQESIAENIRQKENAEMWTTKFVKAMKLAEDVLTKPKFEEFKERMEN